MKKRTFLFILVLISVAHLSYSDINQRPGHDLTAQQHKLDEAIAEYKKAIEINPANATAHYNLGLAYVQKRMLDEAIAEIQIAISLCPDYAMAHTGLGLAYVQKGLLDEAISELTLRIRLSSCSRGRAKVRRS